MSRRIDIVCVSGEREKLQMAAMVASVAAASGDDVTVFFSMNALTHFVKGREMNVKSEGEFGSLLLTDGVPTFKQLFQMAAELGDARLLPCSMAIDLMGIDASELEDGFGPSTGLTRFLGDSDGAQVYTF